LVHKTKVPEGMPKKFWLDLVSSEIGVRTLTSMQYEKKVTPESIVDEYELSPKDKKYVVERAKRLVKEELKKSIENIKIII
jgi:hypothetical protein